MKNPNQTQQPRKDAKRTAPFVMERTGGIPGDTWHERWEIPADEIPKVQRIAEIFGLKTIEELINAWAHGELPNQVRDDTFELLPESVNVRLEGITPEAERVLASIVRKCEIPTHIRNVQQMLLQALNGHVAMYLIECLLHPETGEVLLDCFSEYRNPKWHTKAAA